MGGAKGFAVPNRTARLVFEGDEYEGCEVVVSLNVSFAELEYFERDASEKSNVDILRHFGDSFLISWNYQGEDGPLPANGEGMLALPYWFAVLVLMKWREAVAMQMGVPGPLGEQSKNGATSPEPSEKTAPKSKRRRNLSKRS